jgi:phosphatidylglycerol:prolipoprotein diacylglycerol transferase
LLAIGFLIGTWLVLRDGRRRGMDPDSLLSVVFVVLVAGILGARLFFVLGHLDFFREEPLEALFIWRGGLTLWGGFIVGIPIGIWYTRRHKIDTWKAGDILAAPVALAAAFGRVGCYLNGCCYGSPTDLPWGVHFPEGSEAAIQFAGAAVHPAQLYNTAAGLVVFVVVLIARNFLKAPGQVWWLMMGLYALLRSVIDLTRYYDDSAILFTWGSGRVTESQAISLGIALVSLIAFVWLGRRYRNQQANA